LRDRVHLNTQQPHPRQLHASPSVTNELLQPHPQRVHQRNDRLKISMGQGRVNVSRF
jgi:hypothetical protein